MKREEYIIYKLSNNIGPVAFDYYLNNCDEPISSEIFNMAFPQFLFKTFSSINWNMLWSWYDDKFKINTLYDIKGNIIKIL